MDEDCKIAQTIQGESKNFSSRATHQLSLQLETLEGEEEWQIENIGVDLPPEVQHRMKMVQKLMAVSGTKHYRKVQQQVAKSLGMSVRSLRRLVKSWKEQGISGLSRQPRSDQGEVKTSLEWKKYVVKTYQEGNRGGRQMSPAQVAVRVKARAQELGVEDHPGRTTVYRILRPHIEKRQQQKRSLGWRGDRLKLQTREGIEIGIEWSNQVWQADHTQIDILVVSQTGSVLGRPWLTTVVDSYSRCIMGIHLGFDAPSASVVCLALRHAILPKQYASGYELQKSWGTYGLPQYLYTDGGKDFRSQHLDQVATDLGIVLCLRRKPSDGGIVERPFGTLNSQFFSTLPGYVNSNVTKRSPQAETEACLTLVELERLLVRYIVDHYNQAVDARMGDQSRIGRWDAGRIAQLNLLGERELDLCLMRRDRRMVYRNGYIQFANLTYQGEHLGAYAGESVIIRYNPRDITTVFIYRHQNSKEEFLTRAHAQGWEAETLSYREAQAISQQRRESGKALDNQSILSEVRDRDDTVKTLQRTQKKKRNAKVNQLPVESAAVKIQPAPPQSEPIKETVSTTVESIPEPINESENRKKAVPFVRVYDYEELKRKAGML